MGIPHLVKVGLLGQIGRFTSVEGRLFRRHDEVICRSSRGLEVGVVLCPLDGKTPHQELDGQLLRPLTPEDRLILHRIQRFRDKAFIACNRLIEQRGLEAVLVDVEHLFDGESVYFYFLGEVSAAVHNLNEELGAEYEKKVRFRKFAETLAHGCGPDCGTGAAKCASTGCSSCGINGACKTGGG